MEKSIKKEIIDKNADMCMYLEKMFELPDMDMRTVSPLTLAYIGDGVYDLIIRTIVVKNGNAPVNKLHKKVSDYVKAASQMIMYESIKEELTPEEEAIFKRGRNAKSYTSAKNASKSDYRAATGYEALIGYLYMDNQMDRAVELIKLGLEKCKENKN